MGAFSAIAQELGRTASEVNRARLDSRAARLAETELATKLEDIRKRWGFTEQELALARSAQDIQRQGQNINRDWQIAQTWANIGGPTRNAKGEWVQIKWNPLLKSKQEVPLAGPPPESVEARLKVYSDLLGQTVTDPAMGKSVALFTPEIAKAIAFGMAPLAKQDAVSMFQEAVTYYNTNPELMKQWKVRSPFELWSRIINSYAGIRADNPAAFMRPGGAGGAMDESKMDLRLQRALNAHPEYRQLKLQQEAMRTAAQWAGMQGATAMAQEYERVAGEATLKMSTIVSSLAKQLKVFDPVTGTNYSGQGQGGQGQSTPAPAPATGPVGGMLPITDKSGRVVGQLSMADAMKIPAGYQATVKLADDSTKVVKNIGGKYIVD